MKNVLEISLKDLYHLYVVVAWDIPLQDVIKFARRRGCDLNKEWEQNVLDHSEGASGFCCNLGPGNTDVLVWLKNPLHQHSRASEYGVLFHELFHAVDKITKSHNLDGEQECRAYIYEYLAERCCSHFWSLKEPKNNERKKRRKR